MDGIACVGEKNRKIVATQTYQPGELVFQCFPTAYILHAHLWPVRCQHCFERANVRCANCKVVYYCSRSCQRKDWKKSLHKVECSVLPTLSRRFEAQPEELVNLLLLGRCLRTSQDSLWNLEKLCWYEMDCSPQYATMGQVGLETGLFPTGTSESKVVQHFSRFQCNNFGITDDLLLNIGAGVYILGAMVNHSCQSNCVITYDPVTHCQQFRAIRTIDSGEEITHSYIDCADSTSSRQLLLEQRYHFRCHCIGCSENKYSLSEDDCTGAELLQVNSLIRQAGQVDNVTTEINCLNQALEICSDHLSAHSKRILSLRGMLLTAYIASGQYTMALKHAMEILDIYKHVYSERNHPLLGLHFYTVGDLLINCPQPGMKAADYLLEAKRILSLTHGCSHRLVYGLTSMLQEL